MSARCEKHAAPTLPSMMGQCNDCNAAEELAVATIMRERAESQAMSGSSTAVGGVLIAVPVELAEIDRDREITCALIQEAGNIICHHDTPDSVSAEVVVDAKAFLAAWFKRKLPTLSMPGFGVAER